MNSFHFYFHFAFGAYFGPFLGHFWPPLRPKIFQRSQYGLCRPVVLFDCGISQKKDLIYEFFSYFTIFFFQWSFLAILGYFGNFFAYWLWLGILPKRIACIYVIFIYQNVLWLRISLFWAFHPSVGHSIHPCFRFVHRFAHRFVHWFVHRFLYAIVRIYLLSLVSAFLRPILYWKKSLFISSL